MDIVTPRLYFVTSKLKKLTKGLPEQLLIWTQLSLGMYYRERVLGFCTNRSFQQNSRDIERLKDFTALITWWCILRTSCGVCGLQYRTTTDSPRHRMI